MTRSPSGKIALADALSAGVLFLLFVIVFTTYRDYGITWDEQAHFGYGDRIMRWFGSAFEDDAVLHKGSKTYPGLYDAFGAMVRSLGETKDRFDIMHLVGGLVGVLGVVGAWRLGRLIGGPWAGLWSGSFLALTPTFWGHSFVNPKDAPFAVGYIWGLYYIARLIRCFPAVPKSLWIKMGLAIGAACSVRIAGLLLVCYLLLVLFVLGAHRVLQSRRWVEVAEISNRVGLHLAGCMLVVWAVMIAFWPWAQIDPLHRPVQSLKIMSKFQLHLESRVFAGERVPVYDIPWDYIPRYLLYKLPEFVVVLVGLGFIFGSLALLREFRRTGQVRSGCLVLLLGISTLFPPVYAIVRGSSLYDGIRHFLFVMPPLCVVAGVTLASIQGWFRSSTQHGNSVVVVCASLACVWQLRTMDHLHPHHYTWFNQFSGGMKEVVGKYDVEYYGGSYKEAIAKMDEYLWDTEPKQYLTSVYRVRACGTSYVVARYLPPNFRIDKEKPQLYSGYTRGNCTLARRQHPLVTKVERFGVMLNAVRDLRKVKPKKHRSRSPKKEKTKSRKRSAKPKSTQVLGKKEQITLGTGDPNFRTLLEVDVKEINQSLPVQAEVKID